MARIYTAADQLIGNTPLLELVHIEKEEKLEAKVDKHNSVVERMYRLESRVETLQNELSELRKG